MNFFEWKYSVMWVIFVASFFWLSDSTKKPEISRWGTPNKRFCITYTLVQISLFGTVLEHFGQCDLSSYFQETMMSDIFTQSPTKEKLPAALCVHISQLPRPS